MTLRISTPHPVSLRAALVGATLLASTVLPTMAPAAHAQDAIVVNPDGSAAALTLPAPAPVPALLPAPAPSAPEMPPALWLGQSYYSPPEN